VTPLVLKMRTPDDLIVAADEQMYCAKRAGKNRVSVIP
jgi:PleD family two-component response regulator